MQDGSSLELVLVVTVSLHTLGVGRSSTATCRVGDMSLVAFSCRFSDPSADSATSMKAYNPIMDERANHPRKIWISFFPWYAEQRAKWAHWVSNVEN